MYVCTKCLLPGTRAHIFFGLNQWLCIRLVFYDGIGTLRYCAGLVREIDTQEQWDEIVKEQENVSKKQ